MLAVIAGAIVAAPVAAARERHVDPQWEQRAPIVAFQTQGHKIHELVSRDPHFGGFIFRDAPEPHAVVMFTGDAAARLRRYTVDPRFRAMSVDYTLAELERMKDEMSAQLQRLNIGCFTVDGDEEHNSVTVTMPDPSVLERAIAEGRVRVPPKFRLLQRGCPTFR